MVVWLCFVQYSIQFRVAFNVLHLQIIMSVEVQNMTSFCSGLIVLLQSILLRHFWALVSFLARPKSKITFLGLPLLRKQTETLASQASDL